MNYRHAFHAGNHADVLKHAVLALCLVHLKRKDGAFAVLDTHAGAGIYDLQGEAAQRAPEWRGGVARLWDWAEAPEELAPYRSALRDLNPDGALRLYPGSPALVRAALRPQDRYIGCERHPEEAALLKARFAGDAQAQIHARDGWEALGALLPLRERRGLVLIDPPYEVEGELLRAARALAEASARFSGTFLWWRPLKQAQALAAADAEVRQRAQRPWLRADLAVDAPAGEGRLAASSLLLLNPPFGLDDALRTLLPDLRDRLAAGPGAEWAVTSG